MVLALFRRIAGAGNLLDSYSMISDQSIERSLWLVVSGADGGNQAEIKESPDSRGELLARQFSCSGDLILERSAARIASRRFSASSDASEDLVRWVASEMAKSICTSACRRNSFRVL